MARKGFCGLAAVLTALSLAGPALGAKPPYDRSTILVKFDDPASAAATVLRLGDHPLGLTLNDVEVVRLDKGETVQVKVAQYRKLPGVDYAEPNFLASAQLAKPNDPSYGSQWAWGPIRAVDGWSVYPGSYTSGGAATIGIVDTGVDSRHPDLADGRVLTSLGANCVTASGACSPSSALDDNGHGTHVAGIAAAATNNAIGVAGTAFNAQIIPVKVLDSSAQGSYAAITNGLLWAANHGARAINLSIGGSGYSKTLCDAVTQATTAGAVVVASAGNSSSSAANYPAACPGAVGVAATTSSDSAASFSNYGSPDVFVSAPGKSVYSTYLNGGYATMSGTSMAAPFVTGLAALLLGQQPARTVGDVKTLLATTADKIGGGYGSDPYGTCGGCTWSSAFGYGRIDLYNALTAKSAAATGFQLAVAPATATVDLTGGASYLVTVTASAGFDDLVDLSVSGLPSGAVSVLTPPKVKGSGSSRLLVSVPPGTAAGSYTFTVTGQSGGIVQTATATLVVASDFTIAVQPGIRYVQPGLATAYAITLQAVGMFTGTVDLSVDGLPPGAVAVIAPPSAPAPGSATMTIQAGFLTPTGTYTLTVTGKSGSFVHTATATLVVK